MKDLLTKREKEILLLVIEEQTSQSIASYLNVSIRTVETHRKNILRKTNSKSLIGVFKFAIQEGFIIDYYYQPIISQRKKNT